MNLYKWTPCFLYHPKDSHWWNQASQLGLNGCHFDIQLELMKKATKQRSTILFHRWKLGSVENSAGKKTFEVAGPSHLAVIFGCWVCLCQPSALDKVGALSVCTPNDFGKKSVGISTSTKSDGRGQAPSWLKTGGKAIFPGEWIVSRLQT